MMRRLKLFVVFTALLTACSCRPQSRGLQRRASIAPADGHNPQPVAPPSNLPGGKSVTSDREHPPHFDNVLGGHSVEKTHPQSGIHDKPTPNTDLHGPSPNPPAAHGGQTPGVVHQSPAPGLHNTHSGPTLDDHGQGSAPSTHSGAHNEGTPHQTNGHSSPGHSGAHSGAASHQPTGHGGSGHAGAHGGTEAEESECASHGGHDPSHCRPKKQKNNRARFMLGLTGLAGLGGLKVLSDWKRAEFVKAEAAALELAGTRYAHRAEVSNCIKRCIRDFYLFQETESVPTPAPPADAVFECSYFRLGLEPRTKRVKQCYDMHDRQEKYRLNLEFEQRKALLQNPKAPPLLVPEQAPEQIPEQVPERVPQQVPRRRLRLPDLLPNLNLPGSGNGKRIGIGIGSGSGGNNGNNVNNGNNNKQREKELVGSGASRKSTFQMVKEHIQQRGPWGALQSAMTPGAPSARGGVLGGGAVSAPVTAPFGRVGFK